MSVFKLKDIFFVNAFFQNIFRSLIYVNAIKQISCLKIVFLVIVKIIVIIVKKYDIVVIHYNTDSIIILASKTIQI